MISGAVAATGEPAMFSGKTERIDAQGLPLICRFVDARQAFHWVERSVEHGVADSPLGPLRAVWLEDELCGLSFVAKPSVPASELPLFLWNRRDRARRRENPARARVLMQRIFENYEPDLAPLPLLLCGPPFHLAVWRALLDVPRGQILSYAALALRAGRPGAARAVGSAMARNPIAYLAPCHRVVRADGKAGNYGGGAALKIRLLAWEASFGIDGKRPAFTTFP